MSTAMSAAARPIRPRRVRRLLRWLGFVLAWVLGALFAIAAGDALYSSTLPELRPWHTERLTREFEASQAVPGYGFDAYREQEARLFEEVRAVRSAHFDPVLDSAISRFGPDGGPYAARVEGDWNRSFRMVASPERGVVLLVHGLSDSPYSMRGLAQSLHRAGLTVYGLRLPGHGTLPSGLDATDWKDWLAAVSLTVRHIREAHPQAPFFYGGYSTGATLGLKYAADAVAAQRLDLLPARMFLLSPALGVSPFAPLANVQRLISRWGLAPKARWGNIGVEIDPHKYESFAKNAGSQIAALIGALNKDLARMAEDGSIGRMPPVTGFQSVVDATVSTPDLAGRFYGLLRGGTSTLVLYDVNRRAGLEPLLSFSPRAVIAAFEKAPRRDYRLVVLTNAGGTPTLRELALAPNETVPTERALSLVWPADIYSLSHVALPFPPDDPVYGLAPGPRDDGLPSLGAMAMRGERGALAIGAADQLRLRANPFFGDLLERVLADVGTELARR